MDLRRDAAVALAETIVFIRKIAEEFAVIGLGHFVATVGVVEVQPNAMNVVPQSARLIIDARSESRELMDRFVKRSRGARRRQPSLIESAATDQKSFRTRFRQFATTAYAYC